MMVRSRGRKGSSSSSSKNTEGDVPKGRPQQRMLCSFCLKFTVGVLLLYAFAALFFVKCTWIQRELIYVNRLRIPFFANLSDPSQFGLHHQTKHFFLTHQESQCKIGVWYVPRVSSTPNSLADGYPVVLYLHGNTGTRGTYPRIGVYKYLSEEKNCHVVTFDYQGFGDSDCYPNEKNVMEDGLLVWKWIKEMAPNARVYLWGHSLGSGVATHLTLTLQSLGTAPYSVLLDAPFTNMIEAAYNHPFGLPFKPLGEKFYSYMHENHSSIDRILHIECDIMIFHSHNDYIIPYHVGRKLYETAVSKRNPKSGKVTFVNCGDQAHKYNYLSKELRKAVETFIQ